LCVLLFFALIALVFWLASLHDKPDWGTEPSSGATPHAHDKVSVSP